MLCSLIYHTSFYSVNSLNTKFVIIFVEKPSHAIALAVLETRGIEVKQQSHSSWHSHLGA